MALRSLSCVLVLGFAVACGSGKPRPPALTAAPPQLLFEGPFLTSDTSGAGYDVAADGRFLMVRPVEPEQAITQINLVLNWFNELEAPARH